MINGCFNCVTFCIMVLGWLHEGRTEKVAKKEENEKKEDEQFSLAAISGWPPYNSFWTLLVLLCTGAA